MSRKETLQQIHSQLEQGMGLKKCRQCGCMGETLESLRSVAESLHQEDAGFPEEVDSWLGEMAPIKYACLGCEHCFPAVATNLLNQAFPELTDALSHDCGFEVREQSWPAVPGEYVTFCDDMSRPVAVSTLASVELTEAIAQRRPEGLCIVGKTETENIGIDKLIKNTVTNPGIQVLLLVGQESKGHRTGATLLALWEHGTDEKMRVLHSPGRRPILQNVTREEVEVFRQQVQIVDMMGCDDLDAIAGRIEILAEEFRCTEACDCHRDETLLSISTVPVIQADAPTKIQMDPAGYFVVVPEHERGVITVEHYAYDNRLQRRIEGKDARSVYWTLIANDWVSQLSHAAYLGKELAKAELSLQHGLTYVQDGA